MKLALAVFPALLWLSGVAAADEAFNLESIQKLLDEHSINDMSDLLARLPEDLMANHTFVYASNSRQGASKEFPRAIAFRVPQSETQKELVAIGFNGHPEQKRFNKLELMLYNPRPKGNETTLELFEWQFPPPRDRKGKVVPPRKNPGECLTCHRTEPRFNWPNYDQWPGVYGKDDDHLGADEKDFIDFLRKHKKEGRYAHLKSPEGSDLSPYPQASEGKGDTKFRPNFRFSVLASRINARRVYHLLKRSPEYPKYRSLIARLLLGCGPSKTDETLHPKVRKAIEEKLQAMGMKTKLELNAKDEKLGYFEPDPKNLERVKTLLPLFGLKPEDLTIDRDLPERRYNDGESAFDVLLLGLILKDMGNANPELKRYYQPIELGSYFPEGEAPLGAQRTLYFAPRLVEGLDKVAEKINLNPKDKTIKTFPLKPLSPSLCEILEKKMVDEMDLSQRPQSHSRAADPSAKKTH